MAADASIGQGILNDFLRRHNRRKWNISYFLHPFTTCIVDCNPGLFVFVLDLLCCANLHHILGEFFDFVTLEKPVEFWKMF